MMSDEKSKYGVSIELFDFSQKMFELYQMAVIKASRDAYVSFSDSNGAGVSAQAVVRGETVRKAIQFEIIKGIEIKDVDTLKPYVVTWLADEIQAHVKKVTTAPPDPN